MKKIVIFLIGALLVFPVLSANFKKGKFAKVELLSGDLYSTAGEIEIGTLEGDLFAVGRRATVKNVTGGISYAGERMLITGTVGRSIRFFGRILEIDGEVKGDVLFFGQELRINKGAKINGEIYAGGSDIIINGEVAGPVHVGSGEFVLGGIINSDAKIKSENIRIREGGKILGNLDYWTKKEVKFPEGTVAGKIVYHKITGKKITKQAEKAKKVPSKKKRHFVFSKTWFKIAWFISSLLLGYLFFVLFPGQVKKFNEEILGRPVRSFLLGTAGAFIIPLIVLLLFILIYTIPMNFVILPAYLIGLYLGKLLAGFAIGYILLKGIFNKEISAWISYPVGLIVLVILSFIPYIGWLLMLMARFWGFGAFFYKMKI